jgi:signal transduction histidine kinase/integral membrane sensor domain MASE1
MRADSHPVEEKIDARLIVLRNLLAPAVAAVAYYLACRVGFVLRFSPATTSVLWPPNSILTAAFLLLPRDRWLLCLAFVLPAHLLVELQAGLPLGLVLALYVTNCGEALLAAFIVGGLIGAPARFDSLDRALALVAGAVVIAPLLTTFADAAAVAFFRGEPYWTVWERRLPSNALAGLTIVPSALSLATGGWTWIRSAPLRGKGEAALLALMLVAVARVVFGPADGEVILPGAPYTSLSFLLPLLLWSAVRFGVAGASLSHLATVLLASWAATQGFHPLGNLPASTGVVAMQVFLLVIGIPLTCVAALVEEKRRVERALRENLTFERMLSEISGTFVHAGSDRLDAAFESSLSRLGQSLPADGVVLFGVDAGKEWLWSGNADSPGRDDFVITEPLVVNGRLLGDLTVSRRLGRHSDDLAPRLRLVGAVLANALARDRAEREARRNRDDLAHSLRVSTMGVLASSLAHELNQPLGAIMANAETALERVQDGSASREELLEILQDVVEDDQRAGDVIARMRSMLQKGESHQAPFDVNQAVRDAAHFLKGDTLAHGVTLRLQLETGPAFVQGDRVQIQQVLVNLILNALEATAGAPEGGAEVFVRTSIAEDEVEVSVEDPGPGLPDGFEARIFEPFHSAKPSGMGMGLSISRSIIEAHGGWLRAANRSAGGAVFTFALAVVRPIEPKSNSQPAPDS